MAEGPAHQLSHFSLSFTPDVQGQIQDLLVNYWAHPEMSADQARKQFANIIAGVSRALQALLARRIEQGHMLREQR